MLWMIGGRSKCLVSVRNISFSIVLGTNLEDQVLREETEPAHSRAIPGEGLGTGPLSFLENGAENQHLRPIALHWRI